MADDAAGAGGFCGLLCTGVLQQFFNTRTWGHWTCCDSICRCNCCWDAGEFDPNDPPGGMAAQKAGADQGQQPSDEAAPPAYKAAEPMSAAPAAADGAQPQTVTGDSQGGQSASVGATAVAQTGNTA